MSARPEETGRPEAMPGEADRLECPRCRRPSDRRNGRGFPRCPDCGMRLLPPARKSEVDAWRQLYGRPPPWLR